MAVDLEKEACHRALVKVAEGTSITPMQLAQLLLDGTEKPWRRIVIMENLTAIEQ